MPAAPRHRLAEVFAHHPRAWRDFHYVYPVVSRRSRGLSIGINLNIDKACNFDCIYCCVDRAVPAVRKDIDLAQVRAELERMLDLAGGGALWREPEFAAAPAEYRVLRDLAFSGDGEPTTYRRFDDACRLVAEVKAARGLGTVKIVVITNATGLQRPAVQRGLAILDRNQGEVWAKLDAGSQAYYQEVERTRTPLATVLARILACGRVRPIVLQSLFLAVRGQPVGDAEFDRYVERVRQLLADGCRIARVQVYTVARRTAESFVSPLAPEHLDRLGAGLRAAVPGLDVEVFYGPG